MTRLRRGILPCMTVLILCAASVCSCAPENARTQFRHFTGDGDRKASFTVDLQDTSAACSAAVTVRFPRKGSPDTLTMDITWTSPSGVTASETVLFPSDYAALRQYLRTDRDRSRIRMAATPSCYDVSWDYRDNIRVSEPGLWQVDIWIHGNPDAVLGAGIQISSK